MNDITANETPQIIKNKIFSEQLRILHTNLFISVPANLICAAAVFIGLYYSEKNTIITTWFMAVIAISLIRFVALYFYFHRPEKETIHLTIFIICMAISALLWGLVDSVLMPPTLLEQMIIIVIIAGITAGGLQSLNANLISSIIYVMLIVFPLCIWLYSQHGVTYLVLGMAMSVYLLFTLATSFRGAKILKNNLFLQFQNLSLIDNLSDSNKKLIHSYKILEQQEHELAYINKLNDLLQTCKHTTEAYDIILFIAQMIFNHLSGALVLFNPKSKHVDTTRQWGNDQLLKSDFAETDCWALRKRANYLVNDSAEDLVCYHYKHTPRSYMCLPLILQNGSTGILILHSAHENAINQHQQQLATSFCEVIQLSLSNIQLRETLYEQSIHDPLTGLYNRRYLDETLTRELIRMSRDKTPLCVAMLDLDGFKNFNDSNGHDAGDEVLKLVGNILNEKFNDLDIACRYGGEEFIIVLSNMDLATAHTKLEQVREAVKKMDIIFQGQRLPQITISIGLVEAPTQGIAAKDIINAADQALYSAKHGGRDKIVSVDKTAIVT